MLSARMITTLKLAGATVYFLALPPLLLWLAGDWHWVEGWIFGIWFAASMGGCLLWLRYKDPALLAERMRTPGTGGESRSDLAILIGVKLCSIAWIVLSPLDRRFGWMPRLPFWCEVWGGVFLLAGTFLFLRAVTDNTFLSQLVRIQSERGQRVVDAGVYSFVRHPMYLGAALMFSGGALLLGSVCGLLAGLTTILLLVIRIFGEEKVLVSGLEGYQSYRDRVRFRLVPHVW